MIVTIVLTIILGGGFTFYYFSKVWNASTLEQLKVACTENWYKAYSMNDLPVQCVQFYNQGIILH